jgi:ATP phosphoribosyltransferase
LVKNLDIALVFLPAADIPTFVGEGRVDLGITGRDQVAEYECNSSIGVSGVNEVLDLGFGNCKLQVQVPENSKYTDPSQLVGQRIATSFTELTEKYFSKLEGTGTDTPNGDGDHARKPKTKIRSLSGSVETACTLGVADGIVDLVGPYILLSDSTEGKL